MIGCPSCGAPMSGLAAPGCKEPTRHELDTHGVTVGSKWRRIGWQSGSASPRVVEARGDLIEITEIVPSTLDGGRRLAHARYTYMSGMRAGDGGQSACSYLVSTFRPYEQTEGE